MASLAAAVKRLPASILHTMASPRNRLVAAVVVMFLILISLYRLQLSPIITGAETPPLSPDRVSQSSAVKNTAPETTPTATKTLPLSTEGPGSSRPGIDSEMLPVPSDYHRAPMESEFCAERFGMKYLETLSNNVASYCDPNSASSLTCFRSKTAKDDRLDSFCVGGPAVFDAHERRFKMGCELREWTDEEREQGIPPLERLSTYWYETGPRHLLNHYITIDTPDDDMPLPASTDTPRTHTILIKREETTENPWHALMEILSVSFSLDVLQITRNPATNQPFFHPGDVDNTQVLILDGEPEGPVYDLWGLFSGKPVIRLNDDTVSTVSLHSDNIILPLAGGSNPFWQADWDVLSCDHSDLLRTFSYRVLDFYKVEDIPETEPRPLKLTFIDRTGHRRLVNKKSNLERLQIKYPDLEIELIDLAAISFSEQLNIIRRTDILVGVHGAALTHGMFLQPGSAMVEILPHDLNHKGFRNVAKVLGHRYFTAHSAVAIPEYYLQQENEKVKRWQLEDIFLEEDRFMNLMETAVASMYHRGYLDTDVN